MTTTCKDCDGTGKEPNPSYDDYATTHIRCQACFGSGVKGRRSKAQLKKQG